MIDIITTIDKIIVFLESINCGPFSPGLREALYQLLSIEAVRRKHKFLEPTQVSDRVYFIVEGLARAYYFDENDNERTAWIMKELDVVFSVDSFYTREPSDEWIETLEPTIVGSISYDELQLFYDEFPEFNKVGRILNENYNAQARRRVKEISIYDARKKYEIFTEKYPELVNRVPFRYIASYIGVEKETLYRIRNKSYKNRRKK